MRAGVRALWVVMTALPAAVFSETVGVFYDPAIGQIRFAADEVIKELVSKRFTAEKLTLAQLNEAYPHKKVVIALASNPSVTGVLAAQRGSIPAGLGEQAYGLRTTTSPQTSYWALGGDVNGAMYGGLQIAENIKHSRFAGAHHSQEAPAILRRGIKLNLPWDKASATYGKRDKGTFDGTSSQLAIADVWDMTFWTTWFDEMARHRYNTVSLWSLNPFTSLVSVPGYEDCSIQNVTLFDGTVKPMNIDQKIAFWKQVMAYAHARGFEFFLFNWNVFTYGATGKQGITDGAAGADDPDTRDYMYKAMKKLLETYPDFDGFGLSIGENHGTEDFVWNTYGKAMYEHAKANPRRKLRFIHRLHYSGFSEMKTLFAPIINNPNLTNLTFDLSIKYSQAHMYSTAVPDWYSAEKQTVQDNNLKTWYTVRNDDMYYLNWGDPEFARRYLNGMNSKPEMLAGFYMGSDGYNPTRTFFSKNSVTQGILEVQRQQYMMMLWGRLSYNPNTSDDVFKNYLAVKYPTASSGTLFAAWSKASSCIPKINELVQGTLTLDFHFWPEACLSGRSTGFITADRFSNCKVGSGSSLCDIATSASKGCGGKKSAYLLADEIEADAKSALSMVNGAGAAAHTELGVAINNIRAMSYLSIYYAYKIRGATYLKAGQNAKKTEALGNAHCWWTSYANLMDAMFTGMKNERVDDLPDWHSQDAAVLKEYTDNGGAGTPNCNTVEVLPALNPDRVKIAIRSLTSKSVSFILPKGGLYSLSIFTENGVSMLTMEGAQGVSGINRFDFGKSIGAGVYVIVLDAGEAATIRKRFVLPK